MAAEPTCESVVVPPAVEVKANEKPVAKEKKAKAAKEKKPKASKPATHPPYLKMVAEAIAALKERTGSSLPAIAKYIEEKYKTGLPANFKKQLAVQIKKFSQSGKLVQVKHSYKLSEALKKPKTVKTAKLKTVKENTAKPAKTTKSSETRPAETKKKTKSKPAAKPKASSSIKKKALSPAKKVAKKMAPKKTKASLTPKKVKSMKKVGKPSVKKTKA